MKNILLAVAALVLLASPALAVGPESFSVDVSRGYQVTPPSSSASQSQEQARSNWAPRGQQAQAPEATEEGSAPATKQPRATKASGKPRHHRAPAAAGSAPAHSATGSAPKAAPAQPAAK